MNEEQMIWEAYNMNNTKFYHGSMTELPVGTILKPSDEYEKNWQDTDFYGVLEMYRPKHTMAHKNSVFMCDNPDDIDAAGGGTEYLFTVRPLGKVEKHDLNWGSEISMLLSDGHEFDSEEVMEAAQNYWNGVPHDDPVWEYLTPRAEILGVEEY